MTNRIGIARGQDLYDEEYGFEEMNSEIAKMFMTENSRHSDDKEISSPKLKAFLELERGLIPIPQELDYDKELAEARDERYE